MMRVVTQTFLKKYVTTLFGFHIGETRRSLGHKISD
jgi:hypothetical protein